MVFPGFPGTKPGDRHGFPGFSELRRRTHRKRGPTTMEPLRTSCPLDCPDTCGLEVTIDAGRVVELTGAADHPLTDGYICSKVRRLPKRLYGPDRVLHPLRRSGPKGSGQ